ncbi:RNA-binding protein [Oricola thermophila]|uniref:RNA-binding protein n=1 Tax=Oricola thermophila TaxID=2742145 RepID=A0A6N1VKS3_9HYPH|nr:RNA-binding protein [Oricola thermophila]QKV19537.1 RNA-binding protein [Oricola thermophila]
MTAGKKDDMNDRTCIVTGEARPPEEMIRFVADPDGRVVPDLKRNLPGRGCWVTARRDLVDRAVAKKLFRRGLRREVTVDLELGALVDHLIARRALGHLGLARKARAVVTGAMQVDKAVRSGTAIAVLHDPAAAADGIRKIEQARTFVRSMGGPDIPAFKSFAEGELDLALGAGNVIHAAILDGQPGQAALRSLVFLDRFRHFGAENTQSGGANSNTAKDTTTE